MLVLYVKISGDAWLFSHQIFFSFNVNTCGLSLKVVKVNKLFTEKCFQLSKYKLSKLKQWRKRIESILKILTILIDAIYIFQLHSLDTLTTTTTTSTWQRKQSMFSLEFKIFTTGKRMRSGKCGTLQVISVWDWGKLKWWNKQNKIFNLLSQ